MAGPPAQGGPARVPFLKVARMVNSDHPKELVWNWLAPLTNGEKMAHGTETLFTLGVNL